MGEVLLVSPFCLRAEGCQDRATGLGSSDDLRVAPGCSAVPLSLGDVLRAPFSGVTSRQTQDVSKPPVRCMGVPFHSKAVISRRELELVGRATQPAFRVFFS